MTKMHFVEAARIVRDGDYRDEDERRTVARRFAQLFSTFNARFDHARFYDACGVAL